MFGKNFCLQIHIQHNLTYPTVPETYPEVFVKGKQWMVFVF